MFARLVFGCLALGVGISGCSADGDSAGGGRTGASGGDFGNAQMPPSDPANPAAGGNNAGGAFGNSGGNNADTSMVLNPTANQGEVTVTDSYIWIANSAEGTVSKINTRTMEELGRYLTSASGTGLPSRTSVSESGDVAVANRGNATASMVSGDGGGITKILANTDNCPDQNGDGTIQTSSGANDVLPWGTDECVVWHRPLPHFSNRPVQWAPAPAPDAPANLWTAVADADLANSGAGCIYLACTITVYYLNGETGENIVPPIVISGLSGVDMIMAGGVDPTSALGLLVPLFAFGGGIVKDYGPYGGVSDSGGNFWIFVANTTQLIRIDAVTQQWQIWPTPMGNGYGITIDSKGRIFVCGKLGVSRFDPSLGDAGWYSSWDAGAALTLGYNGCMTDGGEVDADRKPIPGGRELLWVGGGSDEGQTGLFGIDTETLMIADQVNTDAAGRPMNVKGVSIDIDGKVWGVSSPGADMSGAGNLAWRFDPVTREVAAYEGLNGAYSYSDMTGFGLQQAGYIEPVLE